jgi:hypothetical protein
VFATESVRWQGWTCLKLVQVQEHLRRRSRLLTLETVVVVALSPAFMSGRISAIHASRRSASAENQT